MTENDILHPLAKATSQAPMTFVALLGAMQQHLGHPVAPDRLLASLEQLVAQRRLATCRITRDGASHDVFWPTGMVSAAASWTVKPTLRKPPELAAQPPEPISNPPPPEHPMKTETNTARLLAAIQKHGPLHAHDLAERTHVPVKNVDGSLAIAQRNGTIVTRKGYAAERGKELKHYMTPEQAEAWDAQAQDGAPATPEETTAEPAEDTPPAADAGLLASANRMLQERLDGVAHALRGSGLPGLAEVDGRGDLQMHVAALTGAYQQQRAVLDTVSRYFGARDYDSIMDYVHDQLGALHHTKDEYRDPADGADLPTHGKLSLILIDGDNDAQILDQAENLQVAQGVAMDFVSEGRAERAILVTILGEARRTVEWRDAS